MCYNYAQPPLTVETSETKEKKGKWRRRRRREAGLFDGARAATSKTWSARKTDPVALLYFTKNSIDRQTHIKEEVEEFFLTKNLDQ